MAKGLNIDEILASLEQEKTAEENFSDGISAETTEASSETSSESVEAPGNSEEPEVKTAEESTDLEKQAEEYDAQGRIMAKAFMDELQKIAVGEGPYTPLNDDAKKGINELVKGDIPEGGKVDAVVARLKEHEAIANSGSYVQEGGAPAPAAPKAPDETAGSTAAEMGTWNKVGEAKTAETEESPETRIISNLYNSYFKEDN